MADENTEEEEFNPKKSKMKLILAVVIPANLVIIIGVLFLTGAFSSSKETEGDKKKTGPISAVDLGPLVELSSFVVNIEDSKGAQYLKAGLTVELTGEEAKPVFDSSKMIIRNEVLMYLSSLEPENMKGVKNKRAIQTTIQKQINKRLKSNVVKGVYFTEFVTQ